MRIWDLKKVFERIYMISFKRQYHEMEDVLG
jgi:hypothetical protein